MPLTEAVSPGFSYPGAPIHLTRETIKNFSTLFQIESKLPEHNIYNVFHDFRKTRFVSIIILMADTEILLNYVPEF